MIKKKEIVEHVAASTHLNKRDARESLETALAFLHERLTACEEVQIPPLGKIRVVRQNEGSSREKIVYRLILSKPKAPGDAEDVETIAEAHAAE